MCNLYRLRSAAGEIATTFAVEHQPGINFAEEVYPGYPGLVVAEGRLRAMTWGFPRPMTGRDGRPIRPKAVTNARDDKLHTWFWRGSFAQRRCLIPVSAWAEPQGEPRRMTRTGYGLPESGSADPGRPVSELFAIGGLWRETDDWGAAFAMVMVDSSPQMAEVHDRMPVILRREDWPRWTAPDPGDALALCRTWPGPLRVEPTDQPWVPPRAAPAATLFD